MAPFFSPSPVVSCECRALLAFRFFFSDFFCGLFDGAGLPGAGSRTGVFSAPPLLASFFLKFLKEEWSFGFFSDPLFVFSLF